MATARCNMCGSETVIGLLRPRLCTTCVAAWAAEMRQPLPNARFIGLFHYRGPVRELLLRAKIRSDHQALDLIENLLLMRREAFDAAAWADAVIPCPSSLWGRLRGRLDVAHQLAGALAWHVERPLIEAPADLFWRLRKRAQHKTGRDQSAPKRLRIVAGSFRQRWRTKIEALSPHPARLLLVDDIATTGQTLRRVMAAIPSGCEVRVLTFGCGASADASLQDAWESGSSTFRLRARMDEPTSDSSNDPPRTLGELKVLQR